MREQTHAARGTLALVIASALTTFMSAQTLDGGLSRRSALGIALGPNERGAAVTAVSPGSAAEAGGIMTGDVIGAIDGTVVRLPADLIAAVARHAAGDSIRLDIIRAGKSESHDVRLGSFPRETMPGVTFEYGGVTLRDGSRLRTILDGTRQIKRAAWPNHERAIGGERARDDWPFAIEVRHLAWRIGPDAAGVGAGATCTLWGSQDSAAH